MARFSPVEDITEPDFRKLLAANPGSFAITAGFYRLVARADGELVGTILVKCEDPNLDQVEIGYAIKADQQAKGLGLQMVQEACAMIFRDSRYSIIWAKVHRDNVASIKILTKIGFSARWTEPGGELVVYCLEKKPGWKKT